MGAPRKNPPLNAASETERLAAEGFAIVGIAKHLGVTSATFKRWCNEDEALHEAFQVGRERERQYLHSLIVQSAALHKPANTNAMFILKCTHGYREFDSPYNKVDVSVEVHQPVMVVRSHGTDAEWQAQAAAHQRALVAGCAADSRPPETQQRTIEAPAYIVPVEVAATPSQNWTPPEWKAKS